MMGRGFGQAGGRLAGRGFAHPGFFFPVGGFVLFMFMALLVALVVVAFWRIFHKAGFPGVLALLMLIPIVNVGVMIYLGFADWPALRRAVAPEVLVAPPVAAVPAAEPAVVAPDAQAPVDDGAVKDAPEGPSA